MQNHGHVEWCDLMSDDVDKARDFYTDLFGWNTEVMDGGTGPVHRVQGRRDSGGRADGQAAGRAGASAPTAWTSYVRWTTSMRAPPGWRTPEAWCAPADGHPHGGTDVDHPRSDRRSHRDHHVCESRGRPRGLRRAERSRTMIANPPALAGGARCAVAFTFDMDADSILHLSHHRSADTRVAAMSALRYGPEVAVPRPVELYREFDMRQTFFPACLVHRALPAGGGAHPEGRHGGRSPPLPARARQRDVRRRGAVLVRNAAST